MTMGAARNASPPLSADAVVARLAARWTAPIPDGVAARAKLAIADLVAAALAGSVEPEQAALRDTLLARGAGGPCTVLGASARAQPAVAACLNASAGTTLELDDRLPEGRCHPGVHAVPVALALAEERGARGADLVRAVVLGYEVSAHLGAIFHRRPAWLHPHGFFSTITAAVAGAAVASFGVDRLADVINCAAALTPLPPFEAAWEGATVRNAYAGFACTIALRCLECVEAGLTGPARGLPHLAARVGVEDALPPADDSSYAVERATFKFLPVCFTLHPYLQALRAVRARAARAQVVRIEVTGPASLRSFMAADPPNALAARFSLPFALAADAREPLRPGRPLPLADAKVRALARAVSLRAGSEPPAVAVWSADGTCVREAVGEEAPPTGGGAPEEAAHQKFLALTTPRVGAESAARLWVDLMGIDALAHLDLGAVIPRGGAPT